MNAASRDITAAAISVSGSIGSPGFFRLFAMTGSAVGGACGTNLSPPKTRDSIDERPCEVGSVASGMVMFSRDLHPTAPASNPAQTHCFHRPLMAAPSVGVAMNFNPNSLELGNEAGRRLDDQFAREMHGLPSISTDGLDNFQQIA